MRLLVTLSTLSLLAPAARAQLGDLEREPVSYSATRGDNAVLRLEDALAAGEATVARDDARGWLPGLLDALDVPRSSQVLVFSKTSFQAERIAPETPRALYFNDDVYVGFCKDGEVLEVSASDVSLGTAFYTVDQRGAGPLAFTRRGDDCLTCHASSPTGGAPGHLVRSVFADARGLPLLAAGTYRTTHASPFGERWGGWYVTGTHGDARHLGNQRFAEGHDPRAEPAAAAQNVTDLATLVDTAPYVTPHSDLVALLVLEHQTEGHNRIARAQLVTRQALHYQRTLNAELGEAPDHEWPSATRRIERVGDELAEYLLMSGEAPLPAPVRGTSAFAEEFAARGPFDGEGRTLRALDLEARLFRYPCSYLVYSRAFAELPREVKEHVLRRMVAVLTGADTSPAYAHLSAADRAAVLAILRATLPELPEPSGSPVGEAR